MKSALRNLRWAVFLVSFVACTNGAQEREGALCDPMTLPCRPEPADAMPTDAMIADAMPADAMTSELPKAEPSVVEPQTTVDSGLVSGDDASAAAARSNDASSSTDAGLVGASVDAAPMCQPSCKTDGPTTCSSTPGVCVCGDDTLLWDSYCYSPAGNWKLAAFGNGFTDGMVFLQKVQVSSAGTLAGFGLQPIGTMGMARMVLYRDANGVPGALVAQSNAMMTVGPRTHFPSTTTPTLTAGHYWVGANHSVTDLVPGLNFGQAAPNRSEPTRTMSLKLDAALPATWTGTATTMATPYVFYLLLRQ